MSVTSESPLRSKALLLFKNDLQEQRYELTRAVAKIQREIRALADLVPGDVIDASSGNSCKETVFATYSQNQSQLRKVEAALERIATGEFGICDVCGDAITLKRLQALPCANKCIECQEQSEQERIH